MTIKKREQVSVIMTKQPFSVTLKNSLSEVEQLMKANFIRHAPVVDGHRLIGMISKTDLERISFLEIDGEKVKFTDKLVKFIENETKNTTEMLENLKRLIGNNKSLKNKDYSSCYENILSLSQNNSQIKLKFPQKLSSYFFPLKGKSVFSKISFKSNQENN